MNKNIKNKEERDPVKIFSMIFTSMPSLLFRLGGTYLRFKKEAQKAEKIFKRELIKHGIDKKIAEELAKIYSQSSNIRHFFHE